jgi:hypothetical protein
MHPVIIPPLALLLALLLDDNESDAESEKKRRYQDMWASNEICWVCGQVGCPPDAHGDQFGAAPAVALAAPLVAVPPVGLAVAGVAAVGTVGYLAWRWSRPNVQPDITSWAVASATIAASSAATSQALRRSGLRIKDKCIWILSPGGILKQFLELVEDMAMKDSLTMATMGSSSIKGTLKGAGERAIRNLELRQSSLASKLPGISWMIEAVYLLVQALMYIKGTPLLDVALEAFEQLLEDMMTCWNGIRKNWPYQISRAIGSFFSLFVRFARWAMGTAFTKGLGFITVGLLASWLDDYFETQGQPQGVTKDGTGGAMNWLFWILEKDELPPQIVEETDPGRPADRLTYSVSARGPEDFLVKLVSYEIPGMEFELRPGQSHELPQTAWYVYVRRPTDSSWMRMEKMVSSMMVDADGRPVTYSFALDGDRVSILDPTGKSIWSDVLVPSTIPETPQLDDLGAMASWSADPGFFLRPRTAPGSSKATYAKQSLLDPGRVPPGEYQLVMRQGGDVLEVASKIYLAPGETYRVFVGDDGVHFKEVR